MEYKGLNKMEIITIMGKPIPLARHRTTRAGNTYHPQAKQLKQVQKELRLQWRKKPIGSHIILHVTFLMPITKGSKKAVDDMLNGTTRHVKKPDLSNLIKWVEDAGNGIIWQDDKQIFEIEASKAFAREPQTIIRVEW
jgi:Holliday junction resolvase RusA-like endonuclease